MKLKHYIYYITYIQIYQYVRKLLLSPKHVFCKGIFFSDYVSSRNHVIKSFLEGIIDEIPSKKNSAMETARCIDYIYYMRNSTFISPLSFMQSLLTYYVTGSKAAVVLNSVGHPSGSYTTVNNWIKEYSKEALQCPNEVDVVTFFDNNQVCILLISTSLSCNVSCLSFLVNDCLNAITIEYLKI